MLVAGEASGDQLGAGLARALRRRLGPRLRLVGVGGAAMAREGVRSPIDIAQLSIFGLFEGLLASGKILRLADQTAALADREQPDVAVLIDSWGYTLRVARRLRRRRPNLPIIKYVGPQVWASRPGRAKTLAEATDHLLSINTLDAPYFEREGLPVTFVGNPALARALSAADGAGFRSRIGLAADRPLLLVALGSRPSEVARLSAPFAEALQILRPRFPELRIVVPVAETVADEVRATVAEWPYAAHLVFDPAERDEAMAAADLALACSGTLTLELAMAGCPVVVAYRLGALTHAMLKRIIRTPYVTLFNIAAGRAVAPELIQQDCTGPKLAAALTARLEDPELRERQRDAQFAALDMMGRDVGDPAEAAAAVVLEMVETRRRQAA